MTKENHIPVLLNELIHYLNSKPNQNFIDATAGFGGHLKEILKKTAPKGKVLAIDYDLQAVNHLQSAISNERLAIRHGNFKNIEQIVRETRFKNINGIYFDLGFGSWQIEDEKYGFSFEKDMPIDMRLNSKEKLTEIFRKYGEIRKPHQIAEKIVQSRTKKPIETTLQLVETTGVHNKKVLAKIFQSLRITVNDEIENLKKALPKGWEILNPKGKMAVIAFHSIEDRIVKNFGKQYRFLNKKPYSKKLGLSFERSAKIRTIII